MVDRVAFALLPLVINPLFKDKLPVCLFRKPENPLQFFTDRMPAMLEPSGVSQTNESPIRRLWGRLTEEASLKLLGRGDLAFKKKIKSHPSILSARNLGTIIAIEIKTPEKSGYLNNLSEKISSYFIQRGILLRPLGNVLYILPPYCISQGDLTYIYTCIETFLNDEFK